MASDAEVAFFRKEQLMKRMVCMTLMLCLLLPCLFSCEQEKEWNIPETAETLYPVVEGRRVPFKYLFTAQVKNAGECFILRSADDVRQGFKQEFLYAMDMQEDIEALLLGIDYDKYQVLGLSTSVHGIPDLVELIDRDGTVCVVYEYAPMTRKREEGEVHRDYLEVIPQPKTVVILVRKSDFDLSHINRTFSANADQYSCYPNNPGRVTKKTLY
jgi:hypothetical protein